MAVTGIVAEYNPFHNGHAYQIEQARQLTGCDSLIVAISGDFVQRGTPAVIDKEIRTIAALYSGADMVLQIPVAYSTASAEAFAYGGVSLLVSAGIDTLVFGCEDPDLELLQTLADIYSDEPANYKERLQYYLKEGRAFPVARSLATLDYISEANAYKGNFSELIEHTLKQPNNILAIEYLKALRRLEKEGGLTSPIKICPIRRIGTDYHSLETLGHICSATALREMFSKDLHGAWTNYVPSNSVECISSYFMSNAPIYEDDFSSELGYCILRSKKEGFSHFADGNEEISNRVLNHLDEYSNFSSFAKCLQTKDITYARICRFLLHVLLNITQEEILLLKNNPTPYIRVLGFHKKSAHLLSDIADLNRAPLLTNLKNATELLSGDALLLLEADVFARELYLSKIHGQTDYQFPVILR